MLVPQQLTPSAIVSSSSYLKISARRCRPAGIAARCGISPGSQNNEPFGSSADDVERLARAEFLNTVRSANVNLAKAALLVSLEEQAASAAFKAGASLHQLWAEDVAVRSAFSREVGAVSTWNLERFDALADEVTHMLFVQTGAFRSSSGDNTMPPLLSRPQLPTRDSKGDPHPPQSITSPTSDGTADAAAAAVASARQRALRQLALVQADAVASSNSDVASSTVDAGSSKISDIGSGAGVGRYDIGQPPRSMPHSDFPFTLVSAINTVLYDRHGYTRMERHGNPLSSQLNAVLEGGYGSPLLMAILYAEVARRAGLVLHFLLLDGAQYCLLWPPSTCPQPSLLIDPYHKGDLLSSEEVRELFELGDDDGAAFRPASDHELLDALLATLQGAHWAAAAGSPPEPALRLPLAPSTALMRGNRRLAPFALGRAVAAAERRSAVLPCWSTQLEVAVLYHLEGQLERAWQELALCAEQLPAEMEGTTAASHLAVLVERTRLQLAGDS